VLISMLLPALSRARQQAQTVQCLTQLRQFGQVDFMYSADYNGYVFPCYWYSGGIYMRTILSSYIKLSTTEQNNSGGIGSLSQRIYVCPVVQNENTRQFPNTYGCNRSVHPDEEPEFSNTSNPVNSNIGFYKDPGGTCWDQPYKRSQIHRTSEVVAMADAALGAGAAAQGNASVAYLNAGWMYGTRGSDTFLANPANAGIPFTHSELGVALTGGACPAWAGNTDSAQNYNFRFRHNQNNGCNAVFVDGHASTFRLGRDQKTSDLLAKNVASFY
jgi:prepilin-type processing-associated H-X9-DG protein